MLPRLAAEDLRELAVTSVGHRRRLLDAIAVLDVPTRVHAASVRAVQPLDSEEIAATLELSMTDLSPTVAGRQLDLERSTAKAPIGMRNRP